MKTILDNFLIDFCFKKPFTFLCILILSFGFLLSVDQTILARTNGKSTLSSQIESYSSAYLSTATFVAWISAHPEVIKHYKDYQSNSDKHVSSLTGLKSTFQQGIDFVETQVNLAIRVLNIFSRK